MHETDITRQIDELGRITIPKEIRKMYSLSEHDFLAIHLQKEGLLLKKYDLTETLRNTMNTLMQTITEMDMSQLAYEDRCNAMLHIKALRHLFEESKETVKGED